MKKKACWFMLLILLLGTTVTDLALLRRQSGKTELQPISGRYGEPLPWSEVKLLFPRYTVAVVEDLETGKRFEVERRGGTYHADVQPVTARDTKIMKEIFAEGWTWRRRAIVVEAGLYRIAASMNGMPHGTGKIAGNEFNGHFCLHFLGSKVHKSGSVDPAHNLMIWKAAGQPFNPFLKAKPREVLNLVITAINQEDGELAALGVEPIADMDVWLAGKGLWGQLPQLELARIKAVKEEEERVEYQLEVRLLFPGQQTRVTRHTNLIISLNPVAGRWLIEGEGLRKLLAPD